MFLLRTGKIRSFRVGHSYRIMKDDLIAYLEGAVATQVDNVRAGISTYRAENGPSAGTPSEDT